MVRCVTCGCSRFDSQGFACARCGGPHGPRWEQVHVNEETKAKLQAHADELKEFGITLEEQQLVQKDAGTTMGAIGLALAVVESVHPHALRDLILFLRDIAIPEEQILRLRLDEPEKISQILSEPRKNESPKKVEQKSQPRKRATKRSKKK